MNARIVISTTLGLLVLGQAVGLAKTTRKDEKKKDEDKAFAAAPFGSRASKDEKKKDEEKSLAMAPIGSGKSADHKKKEGDNLAAAPALLAAAPSVWKPADVRPHGAMFNHAGQTRHLRYLHGCRHMA